MLLCVLYMYIHRLRICMYVLQCISVHNSTQCTGMSVLWLGLHPSIFVCLLAVGGSALWPSSSRWESASRPSLLTASPYTSVIYAASLPSHLRVHPCRYPIYRPLFYPLSGRQGRWWSMNCFHRFSSRGCFSDAIRGHVTNHLLRGFALHLKKPIYFQAGIGMDFCSIAYGLPQLRHSSTLAII